MESAETKRLDVADKIAGLKGSPRHVVEELRRRRTASITDLVDELNGHDAIRKALQRLLHDGIVEQRTKGVYALKEPQDGDE
jgi:predicted transcriptional regulator